MSYKAIYFGATFCSQCKPMRIKFIDTCKRLNIEHEELDADENAEIFEAYRIRNVPFIVVLRDGTAVESGIAADVIKNLADIVSSAKD